MDIEFSKAELPQFEDLKFLGDNYFLLSEEPFWVLDTERVCCLGDLNDGDDWSDYYLYKGSGLQEIINGWFDFLFNV